MAPKSRPLAHPKRLGVGAARSSHPASRSCSRSYKRQTPPFLTRSRRRRLRQSPDASLTQIAFGLPSNSHTRDTAPPWSCHHRAQPRATHQRSAPWRSTNKPCRNSNEPHSGCVKNSLSETRRPTTPSSVDGLIKPFTLPNGGEFRPDPPRPTHVAPEKWRAKLLRNCLKNRLPRPTTGCNFSPEQEETSTGTTKRRWPMRFAWVVKARRLPRCGFRLQPPASTQWTD